MNHTPVLSKRQQKTRLTFITATFELIVERGLDAISVTDIANHANYGRWAFYQYFESKEDAAFHTFIYWMTQLDEYLLQAVSHYESPRREYESWRLIFRATLNQSAFLIQVTQTAMTIWRDRVKAFLVDQFLGHLQAGHFKLMDGVEPEIAARLYVVAMLEMLEYCGRSARTQDDVDELVDQFFVFMFNQPPPK